MNKLNQTKTNMQIQRTQQWLLGVEGAQERAKWVKEINCIVMNRNEIFGGEHTVWYTEVEI